jgi:hypothetical protein
MRCPVCGSTAIRERPERTAQGYRRFRCRCRKQFSERSDGVLNKAQYPSNVIALVVSWLLRYQRGGARVGGEAYTGSGGEPPSQTQGPGRPQTGISMKRTSECVDNGRDLYRANRS